ncbi:uncharacterized protein H6S33_000071 [Morchella sextelata]|uniref:uncharacterized protein n=1 Tax=Morchella sextelata TaxID=1174677 RepID=UPI001D03F663|nr:uncharacterized protein H6S33_000071 [Morchella sextelata]KAH0614435.1 hypothetical protein H6S33_000071 [Morchella sextelata]
MTSESPNFSSGSPSGMNTAGLAAAVVSAVAGVLALFKGWKVWRKGKVAKNHKDVESDAHAEDSFRITGTSNDMRISGAPNTHTNVTIQFISQRPHPPMYPSNYSGES